MSNQLPSNLCHIELLLPAIGTTTAAGSQRGAERNIATPKFLLKNMQRSQDIGRCVELMCAFALMVAPLLPGISFGNDAMALMFVFPDTGRNRT